MSNSWESSIQHGSSFVGKPDWFEFLLPRSALTLLLLLFFVLPLFFLTAESLFSPVYEFIKSLLIPINTGMVYTTFPLQLVIKILLFSFFTFTGVALLWLKISCLYHEVWSTRFYAPSPLHTPYHPDQQGSLVALFNWNLFRFAKVYGPLLGWLFATLVIGTICFLSFTSFTDFGFLTFQLQFSGIVFVMSVLFLFLLLTCFKACWLGVTTMLGDVAAMTEPEKPIEVVFARARKLAFVSPWSIILYPLYVVLTLMVVAEVLYLVITYDVQDVLSFNPNVLPIFCFDLLTIAALIILSALKFLTYHDAMCRYYRHLPR